MSRKEPTVWGALWEAYGKQAAARVAKGAVEGAKREFSPDAAQAALRALDACLQAADDEQRVRIIAAAQEVLDRHGG